MGSCSHANYHSPSELRGRAAVEQLWTKMGIDSFLRQLELGYAGDTLWEGVSASEWGSQTGNPTRCEIWRRESSKDWTAIATAWKGTWDVDIAIQSVAGEDAAYLTTSYDLGWDALSNTMLSGEVSPGAFHRATVAGCLSGLTEPVYYVESVVLASQSY